ncbi:hypothetical protein K474DRAFT_124419 [Panus rudis PR-1116 ss-1]|nr:hypothetical protein K474DRAFT_124419 [Panus rudis PR-1116 ss-1]
MFSPPRGLAFQCTHCTGTFCSQQQLDAHISSFQKFTFNCHWHGCHERFTSEELLWFHVLDEHCGTSHECLWHGCHKTRPKSLKSHLRVHVNLRSFPCNSKHCAYVAKRKQDLKKHQATCKKYALRMQPESIGVAFAETPVNSSKRDSAGTFDVPEPAAWTSNA